MLQNLLQMHLKLLQKATGDLIGNKIPHKIANNSSENNLDTVSRTEKSTEIPI